MDVEKSAKILEAALGTLDLPTATTEVLLDRVVYAYGVDSGELIDDLSIENRERIGDWLNQIRNSIAGSPLSHFLYRIPALTHLALYADMADKVSSLSQAPCLVCATDVGGHFPIEVPPWSHQSTSKVGPALRRAIELNPTYSTRGVMNPSGGMCMRLVFVLPPGATLKDCDNMAKGLLDALQGYLYTNDKQVQHLDLIRLQAEGTTDGYIMVRWAHTSAGLLDDVVNVRRHATILWMSSSSLRLHDHMKD